MHSNSPKNEMHLPLLKRLMEQLAGASVAKTSYDGRTAATKVGNEQSSPPIPIAIIFMTIIGY